MEDRLTAEDRAGAPLWRRPNELGFQETSRGLGGVVAPLLAGFSLAAIATLASADKPPPGKDWAIAALAISVACLLFSMQVAFLALSRNPSPDEYLSWYPEATVDRAWLAHVRGLQARDYTAADWYSKRAGLGYELGLVFFALGLLALMWPREWNEPRIVAMAAAGAALVLELWWSVARLSRGRIKHPVIRKFDPEERAAPSRLATAAILDADRRGAAGLDFPALGLPPDDSALIREIRQLQGAATPHFAPILLDRLRALAQRLPPDDAVRLATDREIAALERLHEAGTIASLDGDAGVKPP